MEGRKVKNGEKSPWGQCLTRPFWLLIGARKLVFFWHQSKARMAGTVWKWSGKTLSPGALLAVLYFLCATFSCPFRLSLVPSICPWVSEDDTSLDLLQKPSFAPQSKSCRKIVGRITRVTGGKCLNLCVFHFKITKSNCREGSKSGKINSCRLILTGLLDLFNIIITPIMTTTVPEQSMDKNQYRLKICCNQMIFID